MNKQFIKRVLGKSSDHSRSAAYMRNYYQTPNGKRAMLRAQIRYAEKKLAAMEAK